MCVCVCVCGYKNVKKQDIQKLNLFLLNYLLTLNVLLFILKHYLVNVNI